MGYVEKKCLRKHCAICDNDNVNMILKDERHPCMLLCGKIHMHVCSATDSAESGAYMIMYSVRMHRMKTIFHINIDCLRHNVSKSANTS